MLDLSRWQFGITTVYHFLFVPVTIGLGFLVAGFETAWLRTGNDRWLRLTKFYGKLFLINFALGVVTGIVQEFQFGMNWSAYSRMVGNIFGAPLAIEALLAFFLESTFLGLWIFGWDRLPRAVHNACMWITAVGTLLSAYFILAANAWMQHPVGSTYDAATKQDVLTSFKDVVFNPAVLAGFPHVIAGCFLTAGALVAGVAMWHLMRGPKRASAGVAASAGAAADAGAGRGDGTSGDTSASDTGAFRSALKAGGITALVAAIGVVVTGDIQGKLFTTQYQPMKMAAAEALYHTASPAPFSLLTIGSLNGTHPIFEITIPRFLSFLATGNFDSTVQGIDNLQKQYAATYGPGSYMPIIPVTYWSFRGMIAAGLLAALIALVALWAIRKNRVPRSRFLLWGAIVMPFLPLLGNSLGWIMTEMGRQPWLVYGQLTTAQGVSDNSAGEVLTSLIVFTLLYGVLAVIEAGLMFKAIRAGLPEEAAVEEAPPEGGPPDATGTGGQAPAALVY